MFEESTNETETGVEDNSTETDDGAVDTDQDNDSKENDNDNSQESDNDVKDNTDDDQVGDYILVLLLVWKSNMSRIIISNVSCVKMFFRRNFLFFFNFFLDYFNRILMKMKLKLMKIQKNKMTKLIPVSKMVITNQKRMLPPMMVPQQKLAKTVAKLKRIALRLKRIALRLKRTAEKLRRIVVKSLRTKRKIVVRLEAMSRVQLVSFSFENFRQLIETAKISIELAAGAI